MRFDRLERTAKVVVDRRCPAQAINAVLHLGKGSSGGELVKLDQDPLAQSHDRGEQRGQRGVLDSS
jgi:hypothetical protein